MISIDDFNTIVKPTWCPGCGDHNTFLAIKQALLELGIEQHEVVFVFDIGCSGNMADKLNTFGFKSLHGRAVPVAMGIKLANPKLHVIAIGGDGGIFEEGINHTMWAARGNHAITVLMNNNRVFGLTTGQPTTTTDKGLKTKISPLGVIEQPINPVQLMLVTHASFIARGFAGDTGQLTQILKRAINFNGFSFVETLQPCVTYNKYNTYQYFRERVFDIEKQKNYSPSDWDKAFNIASIDKGKFATGVIFKDKKAVSYHESITYRKDKKTTLVDEVKAYSIAPYIKEFE